jgi:hypothetical protein
MAAAGVLLLALVMEWSVVHPGSSDQHGPFHGYEVDIVGIIGLIVLIPSAVSVLRDSSSRIALGFATMAVLIVLFGQMAAYLDIVSTARFYGEEPHILTGYYAGWFAILVALLGTVGGWALKDR